MTAAATRTMPVNGPPRLRPHLPIRPLRCPRQWRGSRLGTSLPRSLQTASAGIAPRELPGDAAAARPALHGELQRFTGARLAFARRRRRRNAEVREPPGNRCEVIILPERIERDPDAEPLGEGNLLIDRF